MNFTLMPVPAMGADQCVKCVLMQLTANGCGKTENITMHTDESMIENCERNFRIDLLH